MHAHYNNNLMIHIRSTYIATYVQELIPRSVEQYTSYVVILQYWFLIPSNILNTVIP